jgi:hypothetical protein
LIFLIVSFLAVNIFDGFVAVFITMHASGGTLNCGWQKKSMGLIDGYQRNMSSPALISARSAFRARAHVWIPLLGYSALCGKSSHYVSQSGLLSNTSLNCDNIRQGRSWRIVSQYWSKLTCFTLQGELILW